MSTINLVQGDLSPIIIVKPSGADLTGKPIRFLMNQVGRTETIELTALLQVSGDVHVPLEEGATDTPGLYYGQLVVDGEQISFDRISIYIRPRTT